LLAASPLLADQCVTCHQDTTPGAVADWNASKHSPAGVGCDTCHGDQHSPALFSCGTALQVLLQKRDYTSLLPSDLAREHSL